MEAVSDEVEFYPLASLAQELTQEPYSPWACDLLREEASLRKRALALQQSLGKLIKDYQGLRLSYEEKKFERFLPLLLDEDEASRGYFVEDDAELQEEAALGMAWFYSLGELEARLWQVHQQRRVLLSMVLMGLRQETSETCSLRLLSLLQEALDDIDTAVYSVHRPEVVFWEEELPIYLPSIPQEVVPPESEDKGTDLKSKDSVPLVAPASSLVLPELFVSPLQEGLTLPEIIEEVNHG